MRRAAHSLPVPRFTRHPNSFTLPPSLHGVRRMAVGIARVCAPALVAVLVSGMTAAQEFPSGPVRFVVPLPAGGTMDIIARTLGVPVSRALGYNVIVDNRPGGGGGGIIGTEAVARAPA